MRCSDEAYMSFVCSQFKCHMHGRNLSGCLKYETISFSACDSHGFFHISFFFCIDDFICTKTFCKCKTFLTDIEYNNFFGTEDLCPLHSEHSDCTTTKDCNIFATMIIILEYTVDCYCCRFKHSALFIWNCLVKGYCILLRNYYIVSVASLLSGTNKAVMFAKREVTLLTIVTFHARKKWSTGYTIPNFNFGYAFANFYHITGKFMSQNNWIKMNSVIENTRNVRTTDTRVSDFDFYSSFGYFWFFDFLILYIFICNYYCCFHNIYFLLS